MYSQKKMLLNSERLIPALTRRYCGDCWYCAKAACQSASFNGGIAPIIGAHSTIESPEPVRRVIPPTTTIARTRPTVNSSQCLTAACEWRRSAGVSIALRILLGLLRLEIVVQRLDQLAIDIIGDPEQPAIQTLLQLR